jgi:hypothetical protein
LGGTSEPSLGIALSGIARLRLCMYQQCPPSSPHTRQIRLADARDARATLDIILPTMRDGTTSAVDRDMTEASALACLSLEDTLA